MAAEHRSSYPDARSCAACGDRGFIRVTDPSGAVEETRCPDCRTTELDSARWRLTHGGELAEDDLLLLALAETQAAIDALPPSAPPHDPMHASACALRAYGFIARARGGRGL